MKKGGISVGYLLRPSEGQIQTGKDGLESIRLYIIREREKGKKGGISSIQLVGRVRILLKHA